MLLWLALDLMEQSGLDGAVAGHVCAAALRVCDLGEDPTASAPGVRDMILLLCPCSHVNRGSHQSTGLLRSLL